MIGSIDITSFHPSCDGEVHKRERWNWVNEGINKQREPICLQRIYCAQKIWLWMN
jgi:hypothetical protein